MVTLSCVSASRDMASASDSWHGIAPERQGCVERNVRHVSTDAAASHTLLAGVPAHYSLASCLLLHCCNLVPALRHLLLLEFHKKPYEACR